MKRCAGLIGLAALVALPVHAQREPSPELRDMVEQRISAMAEQLGDDSDVDLSELADQLLDRLQDPVDLNHTTAQELGSLYLVTDIQINALLEHVRRFGKFISIYELQVVDGMDLATLELVRPFLTIRGEGSSRTPLKVMLAKGKHELLFRSQVNIEERRGFLGRDPFGSPYHDPHGDPLPDVDDPAVMDSLRRTNKVYLGSPWKVYTRYRFQYRRQLDFGITAEKDEGEEFFQGTQQRGYDFYSAHLFLRDLGPVKAMALGDYQAQFGQGLTFSSGLSFSRKSAYTMNIKRNAPGLSPYTSVNENQFLRGAGATLQLGKRWEGTAFISKKKYDANLQADGDSASAGLDADLVTFSSFQEDGYHRTFAELDKRNTLEELIYGGHMRYRGKGWDAGATAARVDYGHALSRTRVQPYNQFEFQGHSNTTFGFDWNVPYRNITWFGEVARNVPGGQASTDGGYAGTTGLLAALDKRLSVALLYRELRRDFQGLYSSAFAESTNPWNERGLYTGIEIKPSRQWVFNAYFDQFTFPWLRFQTDAPSNGQEALAQLTWTPARGIQLYVKARRQSRPRNAGDDPSGIPPLVDARQDNLRFNASYRVGPAVTLRTRVETVDYQRAEEPVEHGFVVYQDVIHRPMQGPLEFTGRIMVFGTDSYDARLYAFESDVPGVFSLPPIYGRGMKWYTMLRWSATRHVDLWARYGATLFTDRTAIGSGLQEVAGSRKSDLKVALRLKF